MDVRQAVLEAWPRYRGVLTLSFVLLVALSILVLILLFPPPNTVTDIFYNFSLPISLIFIVFLGLIFSKKGVRWETTSLILVIALFAIPIIYKWQTAKFDGVMFGGLLPWADAMHYYISAQRLMLGSFLNEIASWRPIFSGSLAILLFLTGNNLQMSLAILAALNGVSVFLAARELQKAHSVIVAATFVVICYWYYCAIAGTAMTENLGLCFGCLGFAFLVRGAEGRTLGRIAFGFFLLTIALSVRAGAFFILPALLLWFVLLYRKDFGWKGFLIVGTTILVAMTSNLIFKRVIGNPNGVLFSNYSYTLYGLASGNAGWKQVRIDFPEATNDEIFGLAINKIKKDPGLFVTGMARAFQDYFSMGNGGFSFLRLIGDKNVGNRLLWVLSWAGVAAALISYKRPLSSLILLAFLGILSSTLLVPPNDADSMRVYASTISFTAYIASLGLLLPEILLRKIGVSFASSVQKWSTDALLFPYSLSLLCICLILPLLIRGIRNPPTLDSSLVCSPNEIQILFFMNRGSSIRLAEDGDMRESYLPSLQVTRFRNGTESGPDFYSFLTQELVSLKPGDTISFGGYWKVPSQNQENMQNGYLITYGRLLETGSHQICVTPAKDENLRDNFFYYFISERDVNDNTPLIELYPALTNNIRLLYGLGLFTILLEVFDFWSLPLSNKIFVLANVVLVVIGVVVLLHSTAIYPLTWERRLLQTSDAVHVEGHSYKLDLGIDWMDRRSLRNPPVIIYENGLHLRHPNESLFNIKQRGKGRFSVENGNLFFSASDNSNPQRNGKTYEIFWPTPIPKLYQYGFYIALCMGVFFLSWYSRKPPYKVPA